MKSYKSQHMAYKILAVVKRCRTTTPYSAVDFAHLGSRAAVDQALSRLARAGRLYRLGRGLYIYPRVSQLTGEMRLPSADEVARAFARKLGHRLLPSRPYASNLLRLSTQVPARNEYVTDGRSRTIVLGPYKFYFRRAEPSTLAMRGRAAPLVVQALKDIGRQRVSDEDVRRLCRVIPEKDRKALLRDVRHAPGWMHPVLKAVAAGVRETTHG